jgi:hypothetical protein
MQYVEQLNFYIVQLPCWYYRPSTKPSTISMNVPFARADLASHVLQMCPHTWQDQFNLHKKGTTPMDMYLLLLSLDAIQPVYPRKIQCTIQQDLFSHRQERKQKAWYQVYGQGSQESLHQEALQPLQEAWGMHNTHNTKDCCRYEKDGTEKSDFRTAKKGREKPNPIKHSFVQLSKKMDRLEKAIKKLDAKQKKCCHSNSGSDSE